MRVVLRSLSQHVVHDALPILPHVSQRPPHDIDGVVALPKEVLGLLQQQGDAGVGDDPQRGSSAHVTLKSPSWCIVHPPDAGRTIDLWAGSLPQHLARAGHNAAELTVQLQGLEERKPVSYNTIGLYQSLYASLFISFYFIFTLRRKG